MKLYYAKFKVGRPYLVSFEVERESDVNYFIKQDSVVELIGNNIVLYGKTVRKDDPHIYDNKLTALEELYDVCQENVRQIQVELKQLDTHMGAIALAVLELRRKGMENAQTETN